MQLFYSRKAGKSQRPLSCRFLFRMVLTAYPLVMAAVLMQVRRIQNIRLTVYGLVLLPILMMLLGFHKPAADSLQLWMDREGRLYLLPEKTCMLGNDLLLSCLQEELEESGCVPPEAQEIEHTLSMQKLGRRCVVRCLLKGRLRTKYLLLDESFLEYEKLLAALKKKMD